MSCQSRFVISKRVCSLKLKKKQTILTKWLFKSLINLNATHKLKKKTF